MATTFQSAFAGPARFPLAHQPLTWAHAEFGVRFAALMIDVVILLSIRHLLRNYVIASYTYEDELWAWSGQRILTLISLPYYGWFYSRHGASPGKMVMGLKVVDTRTGLYLSPVRAAFRDTLGKAVSGFTLMFGFLMAAFRGDHKALHDLLFDTVVLRVPPTMPN